MAARWDSESRLRAEVWPLLAIPESRRVSANFFYADSAIFQESPSFSSFLLAASLSPAIFSLSPSASRLVRARLPIPDSAFFSFLLSVRSMAMAIFSFYAAKFSVSDSGIRYLN